MIGLSNYRINTYLSLLFHINNYSTLLDLITFALANQTIDKKETKQKKKKKWGTRLYSF